MEVVLDTSAVIEVLEGTSRGRRLVELVTGKPFATTVFTLFDVRRKEKSLDFVKSMRILPFDEASAQLAASLGKKLEEEGNQMPEVDLFIACIALTRGAALATTDKAFGKLKKLALLDF